MQSRKQYGRVPESDDDGMVVEESKEGGVEDEDEGGGDRSDGRSSGDSEDESSSSSSSLATRYQGPIADSISVLRTVTKHTSLILAGGKEEAEELQRLFIDREFAGWEATLIDNARHLLDKTDKNSDVHRAVRAVFAQSMENSAMERHRFGGEKAAARARGDYESLIRSGRLEKRHLLPRGKSHATDEAIDNAVKIIAGASSTTAWSVRKVRRSQKFPRSTAHSSRTS